MKLRRYILIALAAIALAACHRQPSFTVEAEVADLDGSTVYLEQIGLIKHTLIDSAVIKSGQFRFREDRPAFPDLYRLRCNGRTILLAVDSTETIHMHVSSTFDSVEFEASPRCEQLQQLRQSVRTKSAEEHKAFATKMIVSDPASLVAYYALYQTQGGQLVFDINNDEDRRLFRAVATAMNAWYPESPRTKAIYTQVVDYINAERRAKNAAAMQAFIDESDNAFLDIELPDADGVIRSLSEQRGKVVVLSFSTLEMERSMEYIFAMREIYNAYHAKGLQVFEVYADRNRLLWEEKVRELPWTTVRAELNNEVFTMYNVQQLPTIFLLNRTGEVIGRYNSFESLRSGIESTL